MALTKNSWMAKCTGMKTTCLASYYNPLLYVVHKSFHSHRRVHSTRFELCECICWTITGSVTYTYCSQRPSVKKLSPSARYVVYLLRNNVHWEPCFSTSDTFACSMCIALVRNVGERIVGNECNNVGCL